MTSSIIFRNKNIINIPKCGCTTVIKLCLDIPAYKSHGHSYVNNKCQKHNTIHSCGHHSQSYNPKLETVVIFRYPHERILSYYYSNFSKNVSVEQFINNILNGYHTNPKKFKGSKPKNWSLNNDILHHTGLVCGRLSQLRNIKLVHLSKLNDYWLETFAIDISGYHITNKKTYNSEIDNALLLQIKEKFKSDYEFYDNILKSNDTGIKQLAPSA